MFTVYTEGDMPEKKRLPGVVDRVEGDVAVVVVKDPDSGDNREVYVDKKKLKKVDLKEGDEVSVEISQMIAGADENRVDLVFTGFKSAEMAKRFFHYLVDGGLEDHLIQELSGKGITLEISDCDKEKLSVNFRCSEMKRKQKGLEGRTSKKAGSK